MTRRLAAAAAALLVAAACSSGGGSDGASSTTSTTAGVLDEAAYVDAVSRGLAAEAPATPEDDLRCVARAIVEAIGVDRFHAAGVTVAQAGAPDFEPPQSIADTMDAADRAAMAKRLQSCDFGRIIGAELGTGTSGIACFERGFDRPAARRMIAGLVLNDVSLFDSSRLARLMIECVGLASLIASVAGVELTDAESRCIDEAGRTDTTFLRLLADQFRNVQPRKETASARFGAEVVRCLSPRHRRALASRA